MSTGETNLKALKNDLKAWKNSFIEDHGREPSKDDVKANPQIAAKHKLWKELEKVSKQKESTSTQPVTTSDPPTTPLPVRRTKPKQSNSNAQSHASIFKHAKAAAVHADETTLAAAASANPFSPTKRRPASQTARPLLPQGEDPFVASPSSSATAAEPPNPFAPSASSPSKKSRHANLFTTPIKARPRVSETTVAPSLAEMLMASGEVRSNTRGEMRHGTSPKKLRHLVSVARDTPRAKARKRMRGEEVEQTPRDKRRRITKPPSPIPQENEEGIDDDDDEIMDLSPVKPPTLKNGKGKVFQPVFDDDLAQSKPKPIKAPQGLFFSGPSKVAPIQNATTGSSKPLPLKNERPSRRSASISAATESLSTTPDPPSDTPAEGSGVKSAFVGKRKGKRSLAETEDSASSRSSLPPESTIKSLRDEPPLPPSVANPFGLRPPSPVLEQASQTKGKGKWGERKKGKMDNATIMDDDEGEEDSTEDVKEVEWHARNGFRRTTSASQKPQSEGPFEEEQVDRFRVAASQRLRDESPPPAEAETLQVDLPDEMKRVLHIESPSKRRTEETIVHGLFRGELAPEKLKKQEVWGAGEFDSPEDEEENDWDSEPEGWKGATEM